MKRFVNVRLIVAILLGVLVGNRIVAHRNIERLTDDVSVVAHTARVLSIAGEILPAVLEVDKAQHLLAETTEGSPQPLEDAVRLLEAHLQTLHVETQQQPREQQQAGRLAEMIAAYVADLKASIAALTLDEPHGQHLAASLPNDQRLTTIRHLIDTIKKEEGLRLAELQADSVRTQQIAVGTNVSTAVAAAVILAICGVWIDRALRARQRSAAVIQRAHRKLQQEMDERVRVEHALRKSERIYRGIGESLDYGVWLCDPDGKNTYASPSFLRLVGLTQEQCSEFGWGAVLHPDDADRTIAAWKECVRTGGTWDIEHRFRGADGQWHPVLARGVPVADESGQLLCWAGINLDISRLKRAEQQLQQAHDELERRIEERTVELTHVNQELEREVLEHSIAETRLRERAEEKEALLKEVHHRVKNNLQVISSLLYLQAQQTNDENSIEMFSESRRRVHSMALVHERLYRSPDLARVDFAEYLSNLATSLFASYQTESDRIHMVVDVRDIKLPVDAGVPCGLLANELISNCLKHAFQGREAGCIRVSMRHVADSDVMLSIGDDGIGLPADIHPETSPTFGMQVVMALVQQLHGRLRIHRNGGTEFTIQFPTIS